MNLGFELDREVSPATYLWDRRQEFSGLGDNDAVLSAIQTGVALERAESERARRHWRVVVSAMREAGRRARCEGMSPRRLVADIDRVRQAVETVLFDGRLPGDLAAWAARVVAKMAARAVDHALQEYWGWQGVGGWVATNGTLADQPCQRPMAR